MKPMKIYDAVEEKIRQAIANGDFDDLPNKGKPLDLSTWQRTPEHLRMTYSILKNAGISPQEVNLKSQISELKAELQHLDKETQQEARSEIIKQLNKVTTTHAIQMERLRRR